MMGVKTIGFFYCRVPKYGCKKGEYIMSKVDYNLVQYVNEVSKNNTMFIGNMKLIFTIKRLCTVLEINRNRYNYLVRNNQLDEHILTLRDESYNEVIES